MTLALLLTGWVGVCTAVADNALADGGFEDPASWQVYHDSVTVQAANASKWWVGGDATGWTRPLASEYPFPPLSGQACAGDNDGAGPSAGLVQFVPAGGTHTTVSVSFHYLLWAGADVTTFTYGVFGWNEGDVIDLGMAGPGLEANVLVGPTTLAQPEYYGDWPPADHYTLQTETATFGPGQYDYIGVWFQYELAGGSFYLDEATLATTPEPTSLSLLGFAGLTLLRRRR